MVHYSSSFRNFLSKREGKVADVLYRTLSKRAYRSNFSSVIVTNKEIDYLTFRNDGTISYLPSGKEHLVTEDGEWSREGRQTGRAGKVIRKLFTPRALRMFKDSDFESFTNQYKASFADDFKIEIWDRHKIKDVYDMDRIDGDGSLNNSCMNGDSDYLDIYEKCERLRIVVILNPEGNLAARALLWTISYDVVFMDRFYVAHDYLFDMMRNFAIDNGFYYKRDFKSYDSKTHMICPDGECKDFRWTILTNTSCDAYPYIDTFSYGSDGSLNNYGSGEYTYCNTGGTREGDEERLYDSIAQCDIDYDYAVEINRGRYRGDWTHIDNTVVIGCNRWWTEDDDIIYISGEYYEKDSDDIVEIDGDYYLIDDCCYSDFTDSWHLKADCVESDHHSTWIPKDDAVEVCGEYYHKDDVVPVN